MIWRDAAGRKVESEGRYRVEGTDLVIRKADWADMGRYSYLLFSFKFLDFIFRFTCTAQNGFGIDMVSSFLYPLAAAFY